MNELPVIVVDEPVCAEPSDNRGLSYDSYGSDSESRREYRLVMEEDASLFFRFKVYAAEMDADFGEPVISEYHEDYIVTNALSVIGDYFRAAWKAYAEEIGAIVVFRPPPQEEAV